MAEPFYLYLRRQGGNYYVQFRLDNGTLTNHKSTGTPNYNEARKLAMQWYSSGQIPGLNQNLFYKLKHVVLFFQYKHLYLYRFFL